MATTYTYSINDDFPNSSINQSKFHMEIENSSIVTILIGITIGNNDDPDRVDVIFQSALSAGEKTILDGDTTDPAGGLIAAHDYTDYTPQDLEYYLDANIEVTDPLTNISGPWHNMQILIHRREIYNDTDSPLYLSGHSPLLGEDGLVQGNTNRIANLENIHAKLGYHNQEVVEARFTRPSDLLIYYGYPNSFNSGVNVWNNEKVAQDMAKFRLVVLGDGVQNPTHPDYSNSEIIIPRVQALNPNTLVFGYVSANQSFSNFKTKVNQWRDLNIDGIFIDEAGYDFGVTREQFNQRVDFVHADDLSGGTDTSELLVFANAWNTNHILGTENDVTYPNSTYNSDLVESSLTQNDWILMESFPINTTSFTQGYESVSSWVTRGLRLLSLRYTYGVNFAGVGVINNGNGSGQSLFNFGFISALMWSLGAFGTSDTSYGAGATVTYWTRPDMSNVGRVWSLSPDIQVDAGDSDVYHRFVEFAKLTLDFSASAQSSSITKF